ncbi:hypothetical protein BD779DRAFT_1482189 [Infundibulicybe gibba]|nr:hypothetical protein BD779DRAFT_1482189 [Infundibulicybe gibba]
MTLRGKPGSAGRDPCSYRGFGDCSRAGSHVHPWFMPRLALTTRCQSATVSIPSLLQCMILDYVMIMQHDAVFLMQADRPRNGNKKGNDFWSAQWSQYMTSTIEWDENLFKPTPVVLPHMLSPDALPLVINATATTNPEGTGGLPDAFNSGAFEDLLGVLQCG